MITEVPTEVTEVVIVVAEVVTMEIKKAAEVSSEMSKYHSSLYTFIGKMRTRDMKTTTEVVTEERRKKSSQTQSKRI